jgi:hypothetical protein
MTSLAIGDRRSTQSTACQPLPSCGGSDRAIGEKIQIATRGCQPLPPPPKQHYQPPTAVAYKEIDENNEKEGNGQRS